MSLASGLHRGTASPVHSKASPKVVCLGAGHLTCSSRSRSRRATLGTKPSTGSRLALCAHGQWQTFGPSASHMDGDAEYYNLSNRLAQQYPGFAPTSIQGEQPVDLNSTSEEDIEKEVMQELRRTRPEFGLSPRQINALGLSGPRLNVPDSASLSSRNFVRGEKFDPENFSLGAARGASGGGATGARMGPGRSGGGGARAAYGDYPNYPEGRPLFWPESARYGNPPDLPSLLLQQRVIYVSLPFVPSVTELLVAQCYYLDFDDRNRQKPIYVYLNSTGCMNDKGQAIAADNEFYAIWAALGFTRAPLYTGVTWKAQNQAAVLLSAGQKGHRYTFPHAKISTAPPILNRVFGQTVDAQLQSNQLEYATKYYAAILSRATGKPLAQCQKEFLSRRR
ncbi:ClpP/crotonase-like domain-containing protein [Dunaliella salina]|uniref:ATP-dependent Clp protease proteolytic subunit n=1 Tax=Dunaliella salina TaxID=3046 RepID=A0ABQ7GSC4_DUNSA|nr:ClpP/crotonase-like domain-containing protein [Dunaliella salina]|eukprot:KAF5837483.1 ClpP/crotonase-like domain-containing protein [Dunaliella salina]